jgi:membrane protease YdiL (CAAX protease family)
MLNVSGWGHPAATAIYIATAAVGLVLNRRFALALGQSHRSGRRWLALLGLLIAVVVIHRLLLEVTPGAIDAGSSEDLLLCWPRLGIVLVEILAVPVTEEVMFRRLLFDWFSSSYGVGVALVATTLAFAAWHLPAGPDVLLQQALGGAFLGILRVVGGGIALPAAFHALINGLANAVCEV